MKSKRKYTHKIMHMAHETFQQTSYVQIFEVRQNCILGHLI